MQMFICTIYICLAGISSFCQLCNLFLKVAKELTQSARVVLQIFTKLFEKQW